MVTSEKKKYKWLTNTKFQKQLKIKIVSKKRKYWENNDMYFVYYWGEYNLEQLLGKAIWPWFILIEPVTLLMSTCRQNFM